MFSHFRAPHIDGFSSKVFLRFYFNVTYFICVVVSFFLYVYLCTAYVPGVHKAK